MLDQIFVIVVMVFVSNYLCVFDTLSVWRHEEHALGSTLLRRHFMPNKATLGVSPRDIYLFKGQLVNQIRHSGLFYNEAETAYLGTKHLLISV